MIGRIWRHLLRTNSPLDADKVLPFPVPFVLWRQTSPILHAAIIDDECNEFKIGLWIRAILTARKAPDEVHRALRVRAAMRGRSTEAEVRTVLAEAVMPEGRIGLGSKLSDVGRRIRLTDEEFKTFYSSRSRIGQIGRSGKILVDTNVVSEPMHRVPEPRVVGWLDAQALETLYISTITVAEMRFGVQSLPKGRHRELLHNGLEQAVLLLFTGRVLAFDLAASQAYAKLMANAHQMVGQLQQPAVTLRRQQRPTQ